MAKSTQLPLTINVTQAHIANSESENCWRCAVTLAVYEAMANANLDQVDELYQDFDPTCPFSVSTYQDRIVLWVENGHNDLVLAIARYPEGSVPLHPKQPFAFDVQFVIVEDEDLDNE